MSLIELYISERESYKGFMIVVWSMSSMLTVNLQIKYTYCYMLIMEYVSERDTECF